MSVSFIKINAGELKICIDNYYETILTRCHNDQNLYIKKYIDSCKNSWYTKFIQFLGFTAKIPTKSEVEDELNSNRRYDSPHIRYHRIYDFYIFKINKISDLKILVENSLDEKEIYLSSDFSYLLKYKN